MSSDPAECSRRLSELQCWNYLQNDRSVLEFERLVVRKRFLGEERIERVYRELTIAVNCQLKYESISAFWRIFAANMAKSSARIAN